MAATALDLAIAKLDAILGGAAASAPPAAAAAPAALPPVPSSSALSSASSRPSSAANVAGAAGAAPSTAARQVLTTKAQIKVARVIEAERLPNSEKLLKIQADLGEGDVRQIMAGMAQFIKPEELTQRLVCVASNLKPAKLAGQPSQAMMLAAEAQGPDGQLMVKALVPPEGACPGDLIHLDGVAPPAAYPKVLKLDEWRSVVPGLRVVGGKAAFEGTPLVTRAGLITSEAPDGSEIH